MIFETVKGVKLPLETLLVFTYDASSEPLGNYGALSKDLPKKIKSAFEDEKFSPSGFNTITFYPKDRYPAKRIITCGIGKKGLVGLESLRRAASVLTQRIKSLKVSSCHLLFPQTALKSNEASQAITEGISLSLYEFTKYKSSPNKASLKRISFISDDKSVKEGQRHGEIYAKATCLARDLVNEPAGVMTPVKMAEIAKGVARNGRISINVLDEKQIEKLSMGAFRAVSLGSIEPPRFVHMHYKSSGASRSVAILGKGITYDAGGLCLKTADQMLNMKDDMSGAAAVIGIFSALADLKPRVNIHGIFPATENMPGGAAYKQRDVLKTMGGKTIEVTNTDAEGRLVLSDAICYANNLKPDCIIDIATLTGAIVVSLGSEISGVFATDRKLAQQIVESGKVQGEKIWEMPLEEEYFHDAMISDIADMKNAAGNPGAIMGANFLKQFVNEKIPWAHIDIAGTCLRDKPKFYNPSGATGVIVRTMLRFLERQGS